MNNPLLARLAAAGVLSDSQTDRLAQTAARMRSPIGALALAHGLMDDLQVERTLARQVQTGARFGETAVALGYLRQDALDALLYVQAIRGACVAAEIAVLAHPPAAPAVSAAFVDVLRDHAGTRGVAVS